nr:MAG TPA: hypothetical protein [Caudoviricetes sp.]
METLYFLIGGLYIGFGRFLLLRQKALYQHRRGVCTFLFPACCLDQTRP